MPTQIKRLDKRLKGPANMNTNASMVEQLIQNASNALNSKSSEINKDIQTIMQSPSDNSTRIGSGKVSLYQHPPNMLGEDQTASDLQAKITQGVGNIEESSTLQHSVPVEEGIVSPEPQSSNNSPAKKSQSIEALNEITSENSRPIEIAGIDGSPSEALISDYVMVDVKESINGNELLSNPLKPIRNTVFKSPSAIQASVFRTNPILDEVVYGLHAIRENDPALSNFDIENFALCQKYFFELSQAIVSNIHVTSLNLSNTGMNNISCIELARALRSNASITIVNLEGNNIGPTGMRELADCLSANSTIVELKLSNQHFNGLYGQEVERSFANSMEKNNIILKLGFRFQNAASRNRVDRSISKNREAMRKARSSIIIQN